MNTYAFCTEKWVISISESRLLYACLAFNDMEEEIGGMGKIYNIIIEKWQQD